MRIVKDHARVMVPATSGNLGSGFDALGMALDVWDDVSATLTTGATRVTILGEGAKELPKDDSHLIARVMHETLERLGLPAAGIDLVCRNSIQQGKGMGSSAAAIVAGLMLVRELIDQPEALSPERMLEIATEYEGHPDNAAPCIYGGATLSWRDGEAIAAGSDGESTVGVAGALHTVRLAVHPSVATSLLVPAEILPTKEARAVLPQSVPHRHAALQAARSALLVYALEHDPSLLFEATADLLHQDYRSSSMPHSAAMLRALRDSGWPAVISGAGPSILLFAPVDGALAQVAAAHGFQVIDSKQVSGAHAVAE